MANWIESPDPISQIESRLTPFESGRIGQNTNVRIPVSLHHMLTTTSVDCNRVFDYIAMRISHIFPFWKGTRIDFRFASNNHAVSFILTINKQSIRVEIRTDETGYRDRHNLFPSAPSPKSNFPGKWLRVNVNSLRDAEMIADDIIDVLS